MSAAQSIAEFRALSPHQRDELLRLILGDRELREDLQDRLTIGQRRSKPSRRSRARQGVAVRGH